jgi:hypothetical protein
VCGHGIEHAGKSSLRNASRNTEEFWKICAHQPSEDRDGPVSFFNNPRVDKVVELLMQKLEIPIPDFRRSYRLRISLNKKDKKVLLTGVDSNGACYTLFRSLKVTGLGPSVAVFPCRGQNIQPFSQQVENTKATDFSVQCTFQGHYSEPVLTLKVPMAKLTSETSLEFEMFYHVKRGIFEKVEILNAESRATIG